MQKQKQNLHLMDQLPQQYKIFARPSFALTKCRVTVGKSTESPWFILAVQKQTSISFYIKLCGPTIKILIIGTMYNSYKENLYDKKFHL